MVPIVDSLVAGVGSAWIIVVPGLQMYGFSLQCGGGRNQDDSIL